MFLYKVSSLGTSIKAGQGKNECALEEAVRVHSVLSGAQKDDGVLTERGSLLQKSQFTAQA